MPFYALAQDDLGRPNIVFVLTDDHRYDAIGAAGTKEIHTPNLDRLAGEGIHFTHAVIAVPICSPSRASLLTGMFPHQHGYWSNKNWSSAAGKGFKEPTAMELLSEAGYRTALIGKWHLEPQPWKCGFSEVLTWMPQGADEYVNAKLARGKSDKVKEREGHVTEIFTDDAVDFLQAQRRNAAAERPPFFLWLSYTAPHTPQRPVPEEFTAMYRDLPAGARPPGFPPDERKTGPWAQYYAAISHLDDQIGRVLKAIDDAGLRENTAVIFLGDNGWMMGSHGRYGKVVPEDESTRVPLIMRAPAGIQGWIGKSDALVSSIDVSATWLALAKLAAPERWPGRSLLPLLLDQRPQRPFRDDVFSGFEDEDEWEGAAFRMVRTHEWKYILRPNRSEKELKNLRKKFSKMEKEKKDRKALDLDNEILYDLMKDPHELRNVAEDDDYRNALEVMRDRMREWLDRTNDKALRWMPGEEDFTARPRKKD